MERRTFLVLGAAAVGLAGCTTGESPPPAPPSAAPDPSTPSDPDARRREEVAASEVALIAAYRSAIQDIPDLAADLAPFLAQHEAHLAQVAPGFVAPSESPAPAATSPSASSLDSSSDSSSDAASAPSDTAPSANPSTVLAALADAETDAQGQRATACDGAEDPSLARDLCLIAASEAQHAAALNGLAARETES